MAPDHKIVRPGRIEGRFVSESGEEQIPPLNWGFLPAGDAAITRSVKAKGPVWVVQVPMGRRLISKGIWARQADILASRKQIQDKRAANLSCQNVKNGLPQPIRGGPYAVSGNREEFFPFSLAANNAYSHK